MVLELRLSSSLEETNPMERAQSHLENNDRNKDRREKTRFPIHRELRYKLLDQGVILASGSGHTLDIASGGVAFFADGEIQAGAFIELSISWPVLLFNDCPMRLIVFGRVLRSGCSGSACTIDKYEFRTQAKTREAATPIRHDSMLQRWASAVRKEDLKLRMATA